MYILPSKAGGGGADFMDDDMNACKRGNSQGKYVESKLCLQSKLGKLRTAVLG